VEITTEATVPVVLPSADSLSANDIGGLCREEGIESRVRLHLLLDREMTPAGSYIASISRIRRILVLQFGHEKLQKLIIVDGRRHRRRAC